MWDVATAQDKGASPEQEDRLEVFKTPAADEVLAVLADGMGGHDGGAIAARAFVETARSYWARHLEQPFEPAQLLELICTEAHHVINELAEEQGLQPRSTCVLLFIDGKKAHWSHVGDSRLYWFRDGKLEERTIDHSVAQMLVDAGKIDADEIAEHPDANKVTQSLGGGSAPAIEHGNADLEDGDGFLLCTDGLWSVVETKAMGRAFGGPSLDDSAQALVEQAVDTAGKDADNTSIILIRMNLLQVQEEQLRFRAIVTLNELIAVCNDALEAFVDAADRVTDESVRKLFLDLAAARVDVRDRLVAEVETRGGEPTQDGTLMGAAWQAFGKFRTLLLQKDKVALLEELEIAEDRVRGRFLSALRRRLPAAVQGAIQRELDNVLGSGDLIKAMKQASIERQGG